MWRDGARGCLAGGPATGQTCGMCCRLHVHVCRCSPDNATTHNTCNVNLRLPPCPPLPSACALLLRFGLVQF